MQLVRIAGPTAQLRPLGQVEGLDLKRASAILLDDDTWQVSGYATDEALVELQSRGLTTELVIAPERVAEEREVLFSQMAVQAAAENAYPSTPQGIEDALGALTIAHPALCTRTVLPNPTHENRRVSYVRVASSETGEGRRRVLFIGGAHAREWVPPDALLTLLQRLLAAYEAGTELVVPAFTDPAPTPDIVYPEATIPAADVERILERVELFVAPLVNPDGRAFSQSSPVNAMWRKNRRPPAPGTPPQCRGVDPNRNHDIAWDLERYYDAEGEVAVASSTNPCDPQVYIGPSAASEPETQNVVKLLRDEEIEFFVDVHSYARKLLYPWGMDNNQSRDPSQNYANPEWDDRREGSPGGVYGEYIPEDALSRHVQVGQAMHDAILEASGTDDRARARSRYAVEPSLALYPTTGTASDYAYGVALVDGQPARPVVSFTLECGSDADGEGGFQPVPAMYPKVEREVHLALLAMLVAAAGD